MTSAVAYLRVSTQAQADLGVSLDAQKAQIQAYCAFNGLELSAVYCDAGLSGKRADNRPELQRALDAACRCRGVLVVYSLSRLARSTKDTIAIADRLRSAGAEFASLSEKIDTQSASGKMIWQLFAVLAEYERNQISERVSSALQHKKRKCERVGTIPFGFDLAADGISLVTNDDEQETLHLIRDLRSAGQSYHQIAATLTASGHRTKHGGTKWVHTSVRSIFKRSESMVNA